MVILNSAISKKGKKSAPSSACNNFKNCGYFNETVPTDCLKINPEMSAVMNKGRGSRFLRVQTYYAEIFKNV